MRRLILPVTLVLLMAHPPAWANSDADDKVRFGESITVAPGEKIGDAICFGCLVKVEGEASDVVVFGGNATIDGKTADVAVFGGSVTLGPNADVRGDVDVAGGDIHRDPAARVQGKVASTAGEGMFGFGLGAWFLFVLLGAIPVALMTTLLGYLILKEPRVSVIANAASTQTGSMLLAGLAVAVLTVLLLLFGVRAGHGIRPLLLLLCVGFLVTLVVGYTGVSSWIGRRLTKKAQPLAVVLIGAVAICILQAIPLVGALAGLVFLLVALGAAVWTGYGSAQDWFRAHVG